jgi:hypothetical protein
MLWAGVLVIIVAILSNGLFFVRVPGQGLFPWLNLLLFIVPVPLLVLGLRRAITQPQLYRGKTAGWILSGLSVLLLAFAIFGLYAARNIPSASKAPKVGEKAPDFRLPDTTGKAISLSDLISAPMGSGSPPKAVLLVFYRGYW